MSIATSCWISLGVPFPTVRSRSREHSAHLPSWHCLPQSLPRPQHGKVQQAASPSRPLSIKVVVTLFQALIASFVEDFANPTEATASYFQSLACRLPSHGGFDPHGHPSLLLLAQLHHPDGGNEARSARDNRIPQPFPRSSWQI